MKEAKRIIRTYKVREEPYVKAKERGQKEHMPLATILEQVTEFYSMGYTIEAKKNERSIQIN